MAVRHNDPRTAEVFGPAACPGTATGPAPGAPRLPCPGRGLAQIYCRGCNLVYCQEHAHPAAHNCRGILEVNARRGPEGDAWLAAAGFILVDGGWWWPHGPRRKYVDGGARSVPVPRGKRPKRGAK